MADVAIPTADSSDAIDLDHILSVFDPDDDQPIPQRIRDVVGAVSLSDLQGQLADSQIPSSIMRDAEFTASAVRNLLSLTATEVNDLLTGATISGNTVTITQNDGSTLTLTLPASEAGTTDGVVTSGSFSSDGETLTLTIDDDTSVSISVPSVLRSTGGGAGTVVGGAQIGSSLGTHTQVSYTAGIMQATDIAVPSVDDGDALLITFSSGDISDFTLISLQDIADVPAISAQGTSAVLSGATTRNIVRNGWGQNDWLYIGVSSRLGGFGTGNLRISTNSSPDLYIGTYDFRIVTFGTTNAQGSGFTEVDDEPPTPSATTGNYIRHRDPARIWITQEVPIAETVASADGTDIPDTITDNYRGARLQNPLLPEEGHYYYNYHDGSHHWYEYVPVGAQNTLAWAGVAFNSITGDPFASTDVWLGEHLTPDAAAAAITGYSADNTYYFYSQERSRVQSLSNVVVGVNADTVYNYFSIGAAQNLLPISLGEDTTIAFTGEEIFIATGVKVPFAEGHWSAIRFGGFDDQWHWFLSGELRDKATASAADTASTTNSIRVRSGPTIFSISRTTQDDLLVAVDDPDGISVDEIEVRTN